MAAGLLLSGCGTERPDAATAADASSARAPTPTTSTPSPAATGALEGFPLDIGYDEENGDDHSPVVVTGKPGMAAYKNCDETAWDPHQGTTDVIGVEFRGEAEWARARTLVLYPTAADATSAVDAARASITACPEEETGDDYVRVTTIYDDVRMGDQSVVWTETGGPRQDGEIMFGTGLTVYHLVRVGHAVLASYEYGEGNGGPDARPPAIDRATEADEPVVDQMGRLTVEHAPVLTHQGVGPYRIGMSAEELIAAGGPVDSDQADPCSPLRWTGPDGEQVRGALSTGTGLAYLTVEGGVTPEGVTVGTSLVDLRAAYPDLEGDDRVSAAQLSDSGSYYRFEVDDGRLSSLVLVDLDQQCVS